MDAFISLNLMIGFFFSLLGYPHTLLKEETSPVRGLWLPLPISALPEDRTCILTLAGI